MCLIIDMVESIARRVGEYVRKSVYLRHALAGGVVNLSALARKIAKDLGTDKFHAVHMALRRMEFKEPRQAKEVLENSRIEIRTGISVFIGREGFDKVLDFLKKAHLRNEEFHILQEPGVWVAVLPASFGHELKKYAFKSYEEVVELVIRSPPLIESTPGVVAQICMTLCDAGVNIIEFLSCWTDTILIVDRKDLSSAVESLESLVGLQSCG